MDLCYRCYQQKEHMYVRGDRPTKVCVECYEQHYLSTCKYTTEREALKEQTKRYQKRKQEIVLEHLQNNPCMDCGETHIVVLDFDHRDPNDKHKEVSILLANGSIKQLTEEIEKCDVVCSNCHRKRTAKMFGSWRICS